MENTIQNTPKKGKGHPVPKEVKEQIIKRIKIDGVPAVQAAEEHGINIKTIYNWLTKGASGNPSWSEVAKLKRENKLLLELVGEITVKLSQSQKKS
jgi:transposase-like protein